MKSASTFLLPGVQPAVFPGRQLGHLSLRHELFKLGLFLMLLLGAASLAPANVSTTPPVFPPATSHGMLGAGLFSPPKASATPSTCQHCGHAFHAAEDGGPCLLAECTCPHSMPTCQGCSHLAHLPAVCQAAKCRCGLPLPSASKACTTISSKPTAPAENIVTRQLAQGPGLMLWQKYSITDDAPGPAFQAADWDPGVSQGPGAYQFSMAYLPKSLDPVNGYTGMVWGDLQVFYKASMAADWALSSKTVAWKGLGQTCVSNKVPASWIGKMRTFDMGIMEAGYWKIVTTVQGLRNGVPVGTPLEECFLITAGSVKINNTPGSSTGSWVTYYNDLGPRVGVQLDCNPPDLRENIPPRIAFYLAAPGGSIEDATVPLPTYDDPRMWTTASGAGPAGRFSLTHDSCYDGTTYDPARLYGMPFKLWLAGDPPPETVWVDAGGFGWGGPFAGHAGLWGQLKWGICRIVGGPAAAPPLLYPAPPSSIHSDITFPLDELDMIIDDMADDRADPVTQAPAPEPNEGTPGAYIPLNGGFEKVATDAVGNPIEDWQMPVTTATRGMPCIDPEMRELELKWWKNEDVYMLGQVRFDGSDVVHLDGDGHVTSGKLLIWYYNPIVILDPWLVIPFWSPVLLGANEYMPIPVNVPGGFKPFYVEGLALGTAGVSATVIPAGAPDMLKLTCARELIMSFFERGNWVTRPWFSL
jgi:hypothetical protein